jgi:hypothetical protein
MTISQQVMAVDCRSLGLVIRSGLSMVSIPCALAFFGQFVVFRRVLITLCARVTMFVLHSVPVEYADN